MTGEDVAELAARGLHDPVALTPAQVKAVCASALRQRQPVIMPTPRYPKALMVALYIIAMMEIGAALVLGSYLGA